MTSVLPWKPSAACLGVVVALRALPFQAFGAEDLDAASGDATSQIETQAELTSTSASTVVGDLTVVGGQLGVDYQLKDNSLNIYTDTPLTTTQYISIPEGVTANITLDGVTIDASNLENTPAVEVLGTANITLAENSTSTLIGGKYAAGIQVEVGAEVTIDGEGTLDVTGGSTSAGIGGGNAAGIGDDQMGLVPGTFSTTQDGTAIIEASSISDQSDKSLWSGIIFEGSAGEVYGYQTINGTYIIETSQRSPSKTTQASRFLRVPYSSTKAS